MKKQIIYLLFSTLFLSIPLSLSAVEIEYLGALESNITAPTSITVDNNSLTLLEPFSKEIKIFTANGLFQQKLHIHGDANSVNKLSDNEYLYCDLDAHIVAYVDLSLGLQTDYFKNIYTFLNPIDIIIDDKIYVLDAESKQILVFSKQKVLLSTIQLQDNNGTEILFPNSFAKNSITGNYYVLDQLTSKIWILQPDGTFILSFSTFGGAAGEITRGGEISVSSKGLVYISDRYQNRVLIFTKDGKYLDMIPNSNTNVNFNLPTGVSVDENDVLYVASTENSKIQMFHISASSTETEAVSMEQLRPLANDTVQSEDIEFFVRATAPLTTEIRYIDFELYTLSDSTSPIATQLGVVPTETFDSLLNITFYTAQWVTTELLKDDSEYKWRTRVHTQDTVNSWSSFQMFATSGVPLSFSLAQNYPNPFNPSTTINFTLSKESDVTIKVFNLNGQNVITLVDKSLPAGKHTVNWSGKNTNGQQSATGIYFYRLTADTFVETKKMVLLK